MTRTDIRAILRDPVQRAELLAQTLVATQAREGRYIDLDYARRLVLAMQRK